MTYSLRVGEFDEPVQPKDKSFETHQRPKAWIPTGRLM